MTEIGKTTDLALCRSAAEGSSVAFHTLYRHHAKSITRSVLGIVGDYSLAQDVSQDAWVKIWNHIEKFDGSSSFSTWAHRIAINCALDELRKRKRWSSRFLSWTGLHSETGELDFAGSLDDSPSKQAEKVEDRKMIEAKILSLPEKLRTVLVLREIEGYSYQEIADTLQCKKGTVMSRLHAAREKLMKLHFSNDER